jgi:hypothetical protein
VIPFACSLSDGGFQVWSSFEANGLSSLHSNRLPGAWVYAFAGLGFLNREASKARQRKATRLFYLLDDRIDEIRGHPVGGNACDLSGILDMSAINAFDMSWPIPFLVARISIV